MHAWGRGGKGGLAGVGEGTHAHYLDIIRHYYKSLCISTHSGRLQHIIHTHALLHTLLHTLLRKHALLHTILHKHALLHTILHARALLPTHYYTQRTSSTQFPTQVAYTRSKNKYLEVIDLLGEA